MHNFDWDDVRIFLAIVDAGSVTDAAEQLGVNQSTVSRRITSLEQRLEVALFERSRGSRWILTAAGEQMRGAALLMQDSANSITREVLRNSTEVSGHVTVTFPDHGSHYIGVPTIAEIAKEFPELRITMNISADPLDLGAREADVAIRLSKTIPDNVVARKIGTVSFGVYGTPEWYERYRASEPNIPLIMWHDTDQPMMQWLRSQVPTGEIVYRANRPQAILQLARLGAGVAGMSCMEGESSKELVLFREAGVVRESTLWVISHTDLRTTARVRIVRDRLIEALEAARPQLEFEPD